MPIRPANTRSRSMCSPTVVGRQRSVGRRAKCDAQRAQGASGQRVVRLQNLAAPRPRTADARSSPTSSCVHRASSTSGAPFVNTSTRPSASASVWTVLINLRSDENGTSPTRAKRCVETLRLRDRPFSPQQSARPRSDRPAPSSVRPAAAATRCWRGRRRQARAPVRSADRRRPARRRPDAPRRSAHTRCRSSIDAAARGDDLAHGHLVLGERAGLVGRDDRRRAERLDGAEMAHDGVPPRHPLHADATARPSRPPASPPGTAATASATPRISTSKNADKAADMFDNDDRRDHDDRDDDDDDAEQLADAIELLLQRRRSRSERLRSMPAMRPISVCMPVATTTARPRPKVTAVPL